MSFVPIALIVVIFAAHFRILQQLVSEDNILLVIVMEDF